ncbi:MAG: phage holin family protein [Bacteroidetes bacterium]|nr:phage holin family protein [Bacteroidota bacterium]
MKNYIIKLLASSISVLFAAYFLSSGVHLVKENLVYAFILAVVLGFLNSILKPLLIILTIPATIFSFGLFLLVINASIIMIADYFLEEFKVDSFWWALAFSIVVSIISSIIETVLKKDNIITEDK